MAEPTRRSTAADLAAAGFPDSSVYKALAGFARASGLSLADPGLLASFSESLGVQVQAAVTNPMLQYGVHTERMFEWVVHALGASTLIQPLDQGEGALLDDEQVSSPDFLIVTRSGERLVVEVKNCASASHPPRKDFKRGYLDQLAAYALALGAAAKVAIFWSAWGIWTMVDVPYLLSTTEESKIRLTMFEALAESEMSSLGDTWVHLRPYPFRFRLTFDILGREASDAANEVTLSLVVSNAEMTLGDAVLEGKRDSRVVWYLAMYGMDVHGGEDFFYDSESTAHVDFIAGNDPETCEQQMLSIGPLSSILTRQYRSSSLDDEGQITELPFTQIPDDHPARLLVDGFQGRQVDFAYFHLAPRHKSGDS